MIRTLVILVALCAVLSRAQETTGTITGRVFDATSAAIPGVEVTATQTETGMSRTAKSRADGSYVFPNMPIGPYEISLAPGL